MYRLAALDRYEAIIICFHIYKQRISKSENVSCVGVTPPQSHRHNRDTCTNPRSFTLPCKSD